VKFLLDRQVVLWYASKSRKLTPASRKLLNNPENELLFSAASPWEITIKRGLGRADFRVEPRALRRGLLENGYVELPVTIEHAVGIDALPSVHRDPFDRLILSQAITEGCTLLTADAVLARYPGPIRKI
jgi:PIN domain nuclease of toxin-antitoxin system